MKVFLTAPKTHTATQTQHVLSDKNAQDEARTFLKDIAANLVNANGSVKSGYLRVRDHNYSAGHMGSGATNATNILTQKVLYAYGHDAQQALQTYLNSTSAKNGSTGKIGTRSFVALIQKMEEVELLNSNQASDKTMRRLLIARPGTHRLDTQKLQPLCEQQPDAELQPLSRDGSQIGKPLEPFEDQPRDSFLADQQDDFNLRPSESAPFASEMVQVHFEKELAAHELGPFIAAPTVVRSVIYISELNTFHKENLKPIADQLVKIVNEQSALQNQIYRIIKKNPDNVEHHLDELRSWMKDQISPSLEEKPIEEIASEVQIQAKSALIQLADQWLALENQNKTLRQQGLNDLQSKLTDLSHRAQSQLSSQEVSDATINATLQTLLRKSSEYAIQLNAVKSTGLPGTDFEDKVSPLNGLPESVTRYPVWNRTTNAGGVSRIQDEKGQSWTNPRMLATTQSKPTDKTDKTSLTPANPRLYKDYSGSVQNRKHVYHLLDPSSDKSNAMLVQETAAGIPAFAAGGIYAKLDDTFPEARWKPTVRGYAANESGMHWILEDMAPIRGIDDGTLNFKLQNNRTARTAVMRDMTEMMVALHGKGWALDKDMHELNYDVLAIGTDGNLKLSDSPKDGATSKMMQGDVQQLAFQFLTTACDDKYTRLLSQRFQDVANWAPLNNQQALERFVNYALLTPEEWASYSSPEGVNELSDSDPGSRFMEDAEVRQAAYKALGLSAYANWLERAIKGAEDGTSPATALELSQLIEQHEKPADPMIRQLIRHSAESLNPIFYYI